MRTRASALSRSGAWRENWRSPIRCRSPTQPTSGLPAGRSGHGRPRRRRTRLVSNRRTSPRATTGSWCREVRGIEHLRRPGRRWPMRRCGWPGGLGHLAIGGAGGRCHQLPDAPAPAPMPLHARSRPGRAAPARSSVRRARPGRAPGDPRSRQPDPGSRRHPDHRLVRADLPGRDDGRGGHGGVGGLTQRGDRGRPLLRPRHCPDEPAAQARFGGLGQVRARRGLRAAVARREPGGHHAGHARRRHASARPDRGDRADRAGNHLDGRRLPGLRGGRGLRPQRGTDPAPAGPAAASSRHRSRQPATRLSRRRLASRSPAWMRRSAWPAATTRAGTRTTTTASTTDPWSCCW